MTEKIISELGILNGSSIIGQTIEDIEKTYGVQVCHYSMHVCPGAGVYIPLEAGNRISVLAYPDDIENLKRDAGIF